MFPSAHSRIYYKVCPECGLEFDLRDERQANEWYYGHDCEAVDPDLDSDPNPYDDPTKGDHQ